MMAYSNGQMLPQSSMYQARLNATEQAAQDAKMRLGQRQQETGETVNAGANILGTLAGAIIGGLMTGGPGAIPGAAMGGSIGNLVGKGGQMVVDPQQRTAGNMLAMGQSAAGLAAGAGRGQQAPQMANVPDYASQLQMPQLGQSMLRRGTF